MTEKSREIQIAEKINTHHNEIELEVKALSDTVAQRGGNLSKEQMISTITSIANQNDKSTFKEAFDAAKLVIQSDLAWNDVFITAGKPGLHKAGLFKIAARKSKQLGLLFDYVTTMYDIEGNITKDPNKVNYAQTIIEAIVNNDSSDYGNKGEFLKFTGPEVFKEEIKSSRGVRAALSDMAVRAAIRMHFPEILGAARFSDEIELDKANADDSFRSIVIEESKQLESDLADLQPENVPYEPAENVSVDNKDGVIEAEVKQSAAEPEDVY